MVETIFCLARWILLFITNTGRKTENMTLEEQLQRGTNIIQEFAAFSPDERSDFPEDLHCLKVWLKAKLHDYGAEILNNPEMREMRAVVEMALEAAYRLGKIASRTR